MSKDNPTLTYLVPLETANLLRQEVIMNQCQNMSLILARYVPREVIKNENIDRRSKWRDRWFRDVCYRFRSDYNSEWRDLARAHHDRWQALTSSENNHADIIRFEGVLESNILVGLGGESVMETSLTVGYINGLPMIPGSALKGIARTYALFEIAQQLQVPILVGNALLDFFEKKNENKSLYTPLDHLEMLLELPRESEKEKEKWRECLTELNQYLTSEKNDKKSKPLTEEMILNNEAGIVFRMAFGQQNVAGACIFYDAIVSKLPEDQLFVVDVMTPHYPDYYNSEGKIAPADNQDPNPIQFMAVAEDTHFAFAVRIDHKLVAPDQVGTLHKKIKNWFKRGLRELGAGAKTHAGYGAFHIPEDQ